MFHPAVAVELPQPHRDGRFLPSIRMWHDGEKDSTHASLRGSEERAQKRVRAMYVRCDEQLVASGTQDELVEIEQGLSPIACELGLDLPENFTDVRKRLVVPRDQDRALASDRDVVQELVQTKITAICRIRLVEYANIRLRGVRLLEGACESLYPGAGSCAVLQHGRGRACGYSPSRSKTSLDHASESADVHQGAPFSSILAARWSSLSVCAGSVMFSSPMSPVKRGVDATAR